MKILSLFLFIIIAISSSTYAQIPTVGLLEYDNSSAYEGYTLFPSVDNNYTFLVNNCGNVINSWEQDYTILPAYLVQDGNLVLAGVLNDGKYQRPGKTGVLQIKNWTNEVIWQVTISNEQYGIHHDIEPMPNGNILVLAWEVKTREEAILAGRDSMNLEEEMWPEAILEIEPMGTDSFNIVWEWHVWDHLIQERDSTKNNFGVVADHPELIDINYLTRFSDDWNHANSIHYNQERDEIIVSSRDFDEFWIIDHSTTKEEASSAEGGLAGKGGNLLYRWGNPRTYDSGDESTQILSGQHDVQFITSPESNLSDILIFNNNANRPAPSEFIVMSPKRNSDGSYRITPENEISDITFRFNGNPSGAFDTPFMGSVQILPNDNYLVCASNRSLFVEYDTQGNEVWKYKSPVNIFGISQQGDSINGRTFKIRKYNPNDAIFDDVDTSIKSGSVVMNETISSVCDSIQTFVKDIPFTAYLSAKFQNPIVDIVNIELSKQAAVTIEFYNSVGQKELSFSANDKFLMLDTSSLSKGIKWMRIFDHLTKSSIFYKLVKM